VNLRALLLIIVLALPTVAGAQRVQLERLSYKTYSDSIHKGRAIGLGAGTLALTVGSIVGLDQLWYANAPRAPLHLHDDSRDWFQQDKFGHGFTSYAIGYYYTDLMRWAGFNRKTSIWAGGFMGSFYLLGIEMLDGFSAEWGFSLSDFAANTAGSVFFIGQELLWNEQRITPRSPTTPQTTRSTAPTCLAPTSGSG
jgi:hypothetical protein